MQLNNYLWQPTLSTQFPPLKLVLLHGMGGTGMLWRPIAASLESEWSLLALDQRGHGKSRIFPASGGREKIGYTPLDYGKDVVETLESLQFWPTWILGHSMGVRTAVAAAHLNPKQVKGLILVDLGFSGVAGGGLGEGLAQFLKKLPSDFESREIARQFLFSECPDPSMAQYLMAVSTRTPEGRIDFPFDTAALIQTIEAARDGSVRNWIKDLASEGLPILVLRGAQSLVWSREDFEKEQEVFATYPSVHFVEVPNAGHGLPFEQRTLFVKLIREFTQKKRFEN